MAGSGMDDGGWGTQRHHSHASTRGKPGNERVAVGRGPARAYLLVVHHEDPDVVGGGPRRPHRERRQRQRRKPGGRKLPLLLLAQLVKPRHHVPCVPTHEPGDDRRRQVLEQRGHLVDAVQHKRVARRDRRRRQHARHEREDQLRGRLRQASTRSRSGGGGWGTDGGGGPSVPSRSVADKEQWARHGFAWRRGNAT
eukprot:362899-Chlamydomonas_euryale.AAC.5